MAAPYVSPSIKIGVDNVPWWWPKENPWAIKNMADAYINNARSLSAARMRIAELEAELKEVRNA